MRKRMSEERKGTGKVIYLRKDGQARKARLIQRMIAPSENDITAAAPSTAPGLRLVTFVLGDQEYALEVAEAVEVLKPRKLTAVPLVPGYIKGILSVRGEMVTVIDTKRRIGAGAYGEDDYGRILIASTNSQKVGFLVDRMTGVFETRQALTGADGSPKNGPAGAFIKGVVTFNGREISLLSIERLIEASVKVE